MKKCDYCGRENNDQARSCEECGTQLNDPPVDDKPAKPRDRTWLEWLEWALRYVIMIVLAGLLYLLSFGPVERYCGTVISQGSTPAKITGSGPVVILTGVGTVRAVQYPRWVGVVYRPAFWLESRSSGNGLYARYLRWWQPRPLKNDHKI